MTPRETIEFSSILRLPSSMSNDIKRERTQQVLNELGINHCADNRIGGILHR
jgi:ABC-type multidrug transport system ATPase subunit